MTTTRAIEEFLKSLQGQNYSALTVRAYGDDLRQFLVWVEGIRDVDLLREGFLYTCSQ